MKKKRLLAVVTITVLVTLLCVCCLFYGCSYFTSSETPTPDTSPSPTATSDPTVTIHPEYGELPVYQPGSIELMERGSDNYPFERPYRYVYYSIKSTFWFSLSEEDQEDFYDWVEKETEESNYGEYWNEMLLVKFINRYNFTREQFDTAVEEYLRYFGSSISHEEFEPPNGDIIYTFDNEIINEYYRYE